MRTKTPFEHLIKETQTIVTLLYIVAVGIGMLFNHQKYSEFGINIFDYAGVFEFLVVPFADFKILLFTLISFLFSYMIFRIDIFWSSKYPKSYNFMSFGWGKYWNGKLRYTSYLVLMFVYLYISANFYGELTREAIVNQPPIQLKYQDDQVVSGKFIGIASDILFLYNDPKTLAIPVTALVKEFEIK